MATKATAATTPEPTPPEDTPPEPETEEEVPVEQQAPGQTLSKALVTQHEHDGSGASDPNDPQDVYEHGAFPNDPNQYPDPENPTRSY